MGPKGKGALAINGGTPVRNHPMPDRRALSMEERNSINEALDYYAATGQDPGYQNHFEDQYTRTFVELMGDQGFADAVSSGTAALYVAIAALGLPKHGEVIVSPITDPGTLNAIILNDLVPVLADATPGSMNVGPDQLAERLSDQTSAIVVVHCAGKAAEIDAIFEIAASRNIKVIEDCAQAPLAKWKGKPVGTFGDIAAFSTMYRKAFVTGGTGGLVYTLDEDLHHLALAHADRDKPIWHQNVNDRDPTAYMFPALNFNLDEISCAIGMASVMRLKDTISRRLSWVADLSEHLWATSEICRPYPFSTKDSPFFVPIIVDLEKLAVSKGEFAEAVMAEGIGLNPDYRFVVSEWPWIKPYLSDAFECPNAKNFRDGSFNLYLNENYGAKELEDTVAAIVKVESHFHV